MRQTNISCSVSPEFDELNITLNEPAIKRAAPVLPHCDCAEANAAFFKRPKTKTSSTMVPTQKNKEGLCIHCEHAVFRQPPQSYKQAFANMENLRKSLEKRGLKSA